ncbi:uncharacterized protein DUF1775 [Pseudonocardia hierapolitana]|uniref:Uncharacterized protein DUF1775 n=1 Tax=Pseudonocardia hierapolitana TaxID=1128676 RepID=A0A561SW25_9PSEU|nr:DUF1775 domain-containing protein [Pseudonocardia hierapolitana]TWF79068.1 uncharacterized protein DUF1775 [Pseudonocardia hierapolitana]
MLSAALRLVAVLVPLASLLVGAGIATAAPGGSGLVIEPDHVEPGARDVTLVFHMTDGAAPATGFRLFLPTGRPLVGVTAPTPPGWAVELTTTVLPGPAPSADGPVTEIVSAVAWTATEPRAAGAVDFTLHVDLMPEGAGPVRFRASRTDAAGSTVEWTDSWAEGGPKPAHDALKLALGTPRPAPVAADHGDHHGKAIAVPPPPPATPAGKATTVTAVLAATTALVMLLRALSRRQRRHLDRSMEP